MIQFWALALNCIYDYTSAVVLALNCIYDYTSAVVPLLSPLGRSLSLTGEAWSNQGIDSNVDDSIVLVVLYILERPASGCRPMDDRTNQYHSLTLI